MKMVVAIIRPEALEALKEALLKADVAKMTVSQVRGCGQQMGYTETYRGNIVNVNLLSKIRVEIAVNDEFEQPTVEAIMNAARTGKIGDGKIFVLPIEKCYRIRTGEEGPDAIG
jgi:nitrogen regulatory protein P-II 1